MFTEKQVRQFYVVNSVVSTEPTNASAAGATMLKQSADGKEFFFLHKGATEDGLQRSDLVNLCNIMDIRATAADDMQHKMLKKEVVLDSNVSANPVVGQDYILNVEVKNYIALGDDSIKVVFGAAHCFNNVASDLYRDLAVSLAKNTGNSYAPLFSVALKTASTPEVVTAKTKKASLTGTYTGIIIEEVEQPWRRGVAKQEFVNFEVIPSTIYVNQADQVWGAVTDVTASNTNILPNSKKVADMEWFFHKERGDVYGDAGYPNNIETIYMVDPSLAAGYSFLDIHFYFEGNSHNIGKSEKTMTLVGTKANLAQIVSDLETMLQGYNVVVKKSANW